MVFSFTIIPTWEINAPLCVEWKNTKSPGRMFSADTGVDRLKYPDAVVRPCVQSGKADEKTQWINPLQSKVVGPAPHQT